MGQVGGVVVRGVLSGHQPDVRGDCSECGQHGLGIRPAHNVQRMRPSEVFAQAQAFAQEEGGELTALGGLGDVPERLESPSASPLRVPSKWCRS